MSNQFCKQTISPRSEERHFLLSALPDFLRTNPLTKNIVNEVTEDHYEGKRPFRSVRNAITLYFGVKTVLLCIDRKLRTEGEDILHFLKESYNLKFIVFRDQHVDKNYHYSEPFIDIQYKKDQGHIPVWFTYTDLITGMECYGFI